MTMSGLISASTLNPERHVSFAYSSLFFLLPLAFPPIEHIITKRLHSRLPQKKVYLKTLLTNGTSLRRVSHHRKGKTLVHVGEWGTKQATRRFRQEKEGGEQGGKGAATDDTEGEEGAHDANPLALPFLSDEWPRGTRSVEWPMGVTTSRAFQAGSNDIRGEGESGVSHGEREGVEGFSRASTRLGICDSSAASIVHIPCNRFYGENAVLSCMHRTATINPYYKCYLRRHYYSYR